MNVSLSDTELWAGRAKSYLLSDSRILYVALINSPIAIILSYILWQLVSNACNVLLYFQLSLNLSQVAPRSRSKPPVVFHWIPIIGSSISYGNDPLGFFFKCREKASVGARSPFAQLTNSLCTVWRCFHVHPLRSSRHGRAGRKRK
jgi:sterol 14-demethylase